MAKSKGKVAVVATEFDLDAIMNDAADNGEQKKGKSKAPVFDVPDLAEPIRKWLDADRIEKTQASIKKALRKNIDPIAEDLRRRVCRENKSFINSVVLRPTVGEDGVMVIQPNVFSEIPKTDRDKIEAACIDCGVKYASYFSQEPVISLNEELSLEEKRAVIKKLVEVFGKDWNKVFSVEYPVRVADRFLEDMALDDKVQAVYDKIGSKSKDPVLKLKSCSCRKA